MVITKQQLTSLELFKRLIKDGCIWHFDVVSNKWSECLYRPYHGRCDKQIDKTLQDYESGVDFKICHDAIWIV